MKVNKQDMSTRAYVGVTTFNFTGRNFSGGGDVVLVDTAAEAVSGRINLFTAVPGAIALTPDGSRAYVAVQSVFVNTGYHFTQFAWHRISELAELPLWLIYVAWPVTGVTWLVFLGEQVVDDLRIIFGSAA